MSARAMFCLLTLTCLPTVPAHARTWVVDQHGDGDLTKIVSALHEAVSGDEIVVHPGLYIERPDFLGKDVYLHSSSSPESTRISGRGMWPCMVFQSGETSNAILEGFTLTGAGGSGAIICSGASPTIRNCVFAVGVTGVRIENADPTIEDCAFRGTKTAIEAPSGIPVIRRCVFEDHHGLYGTIDLGASAVIEDCVFRRNEALAGGAVHIQGAAACPRILRCLFESNRATAINGGAIWIRQGCPTIQECLFLANHAAQDGGAIAVEDGGSPIIENCTFYANGAERFGGTLTFWSSAAPLLSNCIIAASTQNGGIFCVGSAPTFVCNDVWGNAGGDYLADCGDPTGENGNINQDPLFCDPGDHNDFHLQEDSPCAPQNNPDCGLIGAYGVGCGPTPIQDASWGGLRALFR